MTPPNISRQNLLRTETLGSAGRREARKCAETELPVRQELDSGTSGVVADLGGNFEGLERALRERKPIRRALPDGGRLHIDRPLPFLCVHEFEDLESQTLARRVTVSNASYLLRPHRTNEASYDPLLSTLGELLSRAFGSALFVRLVETTLGDEERGDGTSLPEFHVRLRASHEAAEAAAADIARAIERAQIDYSVRPPRATIVRNGSGDVPSADGLAWLQVTIPCVYRQGDGQAIYPEVFDQAAALLYDSLLRGVKTFARRCTNLRPSHHRALGRSVFEQAVEKVDQKINEICGSFDFLLSVTPINAREAWCSFRDSGFEQPPQLRYRPLAISPDSVKRELFSLPIEQLEDPTLASLFREKQYELDQQLTMLQLRNRPAFRRASTTVYGEIDPHLSNAARDLLSTIPPPTRCQKHQSEYINCHQLRQRAESLVDDYRQHSPDFEVEVDIRPDIPGGLMVSGPRLLISQHTLIPRERVDSLLHHEISVHLLTYFNGASQGLTLLRSGLAGYEGLQEGLGVFAEYLVGGLSRSRLRLLAARVLACEAMLDGADLVEAHRLLSHDWHFDSQVAFQIVLRVYRGGGLAKDSIYLRGLLELLDQLGRGVDLDVFWLGKIATSHIALMEELRQRELLHEAPVRPRFINDPAAKSRLENARRGLALDDLVDQKGVHCAARILRQ